MKILLSRRFFMEKINIDKIIRSKRKTIALVVTRDATLVVRAPLHAPMDYIEKLVSKKSTWITRKLAETGSRPKPQTKEFVNGEKFLFLGKTYRLQVVNSNDDIIQKDALYIPASVLSHARQIMKQWYKNEARKRISERCNWFSKITGYKPASIKITAAQKRWGSCGPKGTLNFTWRLIMAPQDVIDAVIVHELVHLEQKNHSTFFWSKVRSILPDYKKRVTWLKENQETLKI